MGNGLEKVYLLIFCPRKVQKRTKNAEIAKNTIQTVFDPSFFHTMLGGRLSNRASKKTGKQTCYPGDMAMRKTTSRLREPHTFSRLDFAEVYLIWEFFLNRTLSGPPVNTECTFSRPLQKTRRYTFSRPLPIVSDGLEKVLSVLTGGPDKVRFKTNSQIKCTLAKSGLEKVCGCRRREVVSRMAISPG